MRKWRVGSLSAGILMIVLGAGMPAAQFKQADILEMLFTCWLAILVLIGAEILLQVYIAREQQPVIMNSGAVKSMNWRLSSGIDDPDHRQI